MDTLTIKMIQEIGGTCDGQLTARGAVVTIGEASARDYIANGYAKLYVADEPEPEEEESFAAKILAKTAEVEDDAVETRSVDEDDEDEEDEDEIDREAVQTAEAVPEQNAAERVSKPTPRRRGPARKKA
jgi:hypothetical protein